LSAQARQPILDAGGRPGAVLGPCRRWPLPFGVASRDAGHPVDARAPGPSLVARRFMSPGGEIAGSQRPASSVGRRASGGAGTIRELLARDPEQGPRAAAVRALLVHAASGQTECVPSDFRKPRRGARRGSGAAVAFGQAPGGVHWRPWKRFLCSGRAIPDTTPCRRPAGLCRSQVLHELAGQPAGLSRQRRPIRAFSSSPRLARPICPPDRSAGSARQTYPPDLPARPAGPTYRPDLRA
jgi:hypothetical protein